MKMLYTANGRYIRCCTEEGTRPVIIVCEKEYEVDVQEFMLWSILNWRILREDEIGSYYEKMVSNINVTIHRSWQDCVQRLLVRGLIVAGTALTMPLLNEMLKNPNVIAVKNSSMPTQDIQMFKDAGIQARGADGFAVFNGPDEQFVSGRVMGADGGIGGTYAVMPELFLKMNELIEKGDIPAAREIQYKADRIIYKMCEAHGNLYAVMKEILRRMYGLELGGVRAPLPGLIPEDEAIVAEAQKMIEDAVAAL